MDTTKVDYEKRFNDMTTKYQSRVAKYKNHVSRLEGKNAILKRENHLLRNRVYNMKEKEFLVKEILKVEVDDQPQRRIKKVYTPPKTTPPAAANGTYKGEFGAGVKQDDEAVHANSSL